MTQPDEAAEMRKALAERLITRKWNPSHPEFNKELDELMAIFTPAQARTRQQTLEAVRAGLPKKRTDHKLSDNNFNQAIDAIEAVITKLEKGTE